MTLSVETPFEYISGGDGTITDFEFEFTVSSGDDVKVYVEDNDPTSDTYGVRTLKASVTDYLVTVYANGKGKVVFNDPVTVLKNIYLRRNTSLDQGTDYVEGDDFPADSHEAALDKLTRQQQEQGLTIGAAIRFPDFEDGLFMTELPKASIRAGKQFGFDEDGNISMVTMITQSVLDVIEEDAQTCEDAVITVTGLTSTASAAAVSATTAQGDAEDARDAAVAARDAIPAATDILVDDDIGVTVQGYDADTLKSDTTDTLTVGYTETPLAYTSGDIAVSAGSLRTVDTTSGVTLGMITGVGSVKLVLTGGGAVAYDAGYDFTVGEYDATKAVCIVFATNSGAKKGLVFLNSEA